MADVHPFERRALRLANRIRTQIETVRRGMEPPGTKPPFAVKLSEEEQIEQFLAIEPQGWQELIRREGAAEVRKYARAMADLIERRYGPVKATVVPVTAEDTAWQPRPEGMQPPQPQLPAMPQLPALPQLPVQPAMPAQTVQAAPAPQPDAVQQLVMQALTGAARR